MAKILFVDERPAMSERAMDKLRDFSSVVLPDGVSAQTLFEEIRDAKYLVSGAYRITAEHIRAAQRLKCILIPGAGTEHVDVVYAHEQGIYVVNAPGANSIAVAEQAIALMLAVGRSIPQTYAGVRAGEWVDDGIRARVEGTELTSQTLGLIGLGNIGTRVAQYAKGFDMEVLCCTRRPSPERERTAGVKFVPINELMQEADFVVICAALTSETKGLVGEEQIALMKKDAYLINVARAAIVDNVALYKALKDKTIAGAGLDVLEKEPPGDKHPFFELDNVVVTPHLGSRTKGAIDRASMMIANEILRVEAGEKPIHWVCE